MRVAIAHRLDADELLEAGGRDSATAEHLRIALSGTSFRDPSEDIIWFGFERGETLGSGWAPSRTQIEDIGSATQQLGRRWLSSLSSRLTRTGGGSVGDDEGRILDRAIWALHVRDRLPPVVLVDAFRQITASSGGADQQHGGAGLIERLARLQNPAVGQREDRRRFEAITRFVRTLLEDPAAEIKIPWERDTILIHHDGRLLPLENYGTGLHQVVILAAAATVLTGHLVCVEEPEIHFHPTLQRRLLRYLQHETDNQYLIATHSAHLLDTGRASITAARLVDRQTQLAPAIEPSEIAAISADLGFRASDLVQSNAVVWVEGPSDRIYVRFWLNEIDPQLVEGVHYTLMFYGGALLRHLSADDPAVEEFISLPRINRNFAVVIDSDRSSRNARVNATKARVRKAIEEFGSRASVWITSGYTIENYVPQDLLAAAVHACILRLTSIGTVTATPIHSGLGS